jgi:tRNA-specific 2-thiouridylase
VAGLGGRAFLRRHAAERLHGEGEIVTRDGTVVGRHAGQHDFTVGQRRGIGVAAPEPLYVLAKDARRNRVVVGPRAELTAQRIELEGCRLHRSPDSVRAVKLRYRSQLLPCRLLGDPAGDRAVLELDRPAHAVAPGQLACLLADDRVVGHGTIAEPVE